MPKLFAVSIVLFLLLGAGYGLSQAARSIPWDCSDWQAFAHSDRNTAILESLAENRGKTLYCGIDQSDTFGKAETWAAGKDRNERDDTVYWGERGSFRGFIAAQEGWLTEGGSGITGQSIASIFEFPKEERQRRRKQYRRDVTDPKWYPEGVNIQHHVWYTGPEVSNANQVQAQNDALRDLNAALPAAAERNRWARAGDDFHEWVQGRTPEAEIPYPGGASGFCRALGYDRAVNVDTFVPPESMVVPTYIERQVSGTWYVRARRPIHFNNVDCVRRK